MIPVLARESIILKSRRDFNTILGNYECAYAIGVMSQLSGIPVIEDHSDMQQMHAAFMEKLKDYKPADIHQERIKKILQLYKPAEMMDAQVEELLQWGLREDRLWEI